MERGGLGAATRRRAIVPTGHPAISTRDGDVCFAMRGQPRRRSGSIRRLQARRSRAPLIEHEVPERRHPTVEARALRARGGDRERPQAPREEGRR